MLSDYSIVSKSSKKPPLPRYLYIAAIIGFLLSSILSINTLNGREEQIIIASEKSSRTPNIILLGSDGLNADNMSAYGYQRPTTPVINELAQSSLIAENNFTNASNSGGSVISIFTGKLPFTTSINQSHRFYHNKNLLLFFPHLKIPGTNNLKTPPSIK